ncbi:MAG TPA: hypothetical protein VH207_04755 [Chthoniobacterales bacterium]|nr:hypothetical protein [Chthoniobacterales bacterium]
MAGINAAAEGGDWRAHEEFLRLSFPEYRQPVAKVEVNATAQAAAIVCDEATRARRIAIREKLQADLKG